MRVLRRNFFNLSSSTILLGRSGENEVTQLDVDISRELSEYPNSTFELLFTRPNESDPYPVLTTIEGRVLSYVIGGYDLGIVGYGQLELVMYGSNGEVKKSAVAKTRIEGTLLNGNQYPSSVQKWFDLLRQKQVDIEALLKNLGGIAIYKIGTGIVPTGKVGQLLYCVAGENGKTAEAPIPFEYPDGTIGWKTLPFQAGDLYVCSGSKWNLLCSHAWREDEIGSLINVFADRPDYVTKDWILKLLHSFSITDDGELLASLDSGYVYVDASGVMFISTDGDVSRMNEKDELEVLV